MKAFGFGSGRGARRRRPALPPVAVPQVPGMVAPDLSGVGVAPAFAFHPHSAAVTRNGATVMAVAGTDAMPGLTAPSSGPDAVVDALGRTCWRFEGSNWLELPDSFVSSPRALSVFMVGRQHKNLTVNYFGHSHQSDGVTPANTLGAFLSTSISGSAVAMLTRASTWRSARN